MKPKSLIKRVIWLILISGILTLALIDMQGIIKQDIQYGVALRHILAFSVFVILTKITWPRWHMMHIVLAAIGFGIAIEIAQELFTGGARTFHWHDLMNDGIGIVIGLVIIFLWLRLRSATGAK